jgi:hypothetical protein
MMDRISPKLGRNDAVLAHRPASLTFRPRTSDPPGRAGRVVPRRSTAVRTAAPTGRGHVIHLDTALGEQLLHVPIGQPIPRVRAHRHHDHLRREPGTRRNPAAPEVLDEGHHTSLQPVRPRPRLTHQPPWHRVGLAGPTRWRPGIACPRRRDGRDDCDLYSSRRTR